MRLLAGKLIICIVVLLLALPLLAACDDDETAEPTASPTVGPATTPTAVPTAVPTDQPTAAPTERPPAKPEGTLTIAVPVVHTEPTLGPFSRGAPTSRSYTTPASDYLVYEKSDESGYIPGLATEWEVAADKMSITFKLREGVQFHDGWGELTAQDVKFTIDGVMNPDIGESKMLRKSLNPLLDRVEVSGPDELTMHCKGPWAEVMLDYMAPSNEGWFAIVPQTYYDEVGFTEGNKHPIFSGPYRVAEYIMSEKLVLEAVEDHWRVVPEFQTIIFREIPELSTRLAMLQAGEADIVQVSPDQAVSLEKDGFDIIPVRNAYTLALTLLGQWLPSVDTYDPDIPWLDKRVREAMNLAIDREQLVEHLYHGWATLSPDITYIPWGEAREPYPYDPDRARKLMAEAGYQNGFDAQMWIYTLGAMLPPVDTMISVAAFWQEELGIDCEINSFNILAKYGDILTRNTSGIIAPFGVSHSGQPNWPVLDTIAHSTKSTFPQYESAECDVLVEGLMGAESPEEKETYSGQLAQYFYDEYAFVPLLRIDELYVTNDRVANWNPATLQYLGLEYATHAEPLGTFRLFGTP